MFYLVLCFCSELIFDVPGSFSMKFLFGTGSCFFVTTHYFQCTSSVEASSRRYNYTKIAERFMEF